MTVKAKPVNNLTNFDPPKKNSITELTLVLELLISYLIDRLSISISMVWCD